MTTQVHRAMKKTPARMLYSKTNQLPPALEKPAGVLNSMAKRLAIAKRKRPVWKLYSMTTYKLTALETQPAR